MSFFYRFGIARSAPRLPTPKSVALAVSAMLLTGCASFSPHGGMDAVSAMTRERTGQAVERIPAASDAAALDASIDVLLVQPLSADTAVRIALTNNRGLQASLSELGVVEADFVQAGRLRNPSVSFGRLRGGDDIEIERSIMFDLAGLLTLPLRRDIESRRFEQAKLQAAEHAVKLAADTRRAYFNAVAAQQTAQYMEQVKDAAEAGAELAQGMAKAGNWSKLDQAREQAFHADATAQLARARQNAVAARERLTRAMGLSAKHTAYKLPGRLPDLPSAPAEVGNIEAQALQQRLDVQMARRDAEATASALGLTRTTGFINVFDAGYRTKSQTGAPRSNGYQIELELPLFDWSGAKTAGAEAVYMQAVHRTADIAVRARSEAREAYSAYRTSYDLARHYRDEVVPLRKKISEEMQLRYNGMLVSVFDLLADARAQIGSVNAAIEAQRDFWLADTDLQQAIHGSSGASRELRGSTGPTE
ncbi:TolC family protein [Noviherbaspirillum sp.]|uniref:TolC family protein n=1 Tax=Noviherbaspirillum sp. TaxID=1926288 RepID=UPI002B49FB0C|nr:TolC family protein [Noviherbaspirillum sp.]HJV83728.1 TolC family protein [Noviherbaspirillum sp.]